MKSVPILVFALGLFFVVGSSNAKYLLVDIDDGIDDELPVPISTQHPKGILNPVINYQTLQTDRLSLRYTYIYYRD